MNYFAAATVCKAIANGQGPLGVVKSHFHSDFLALILQSDLLGIFRPGAYVYLKARRVELKLEMSESLRHQSLVMSATTT